MRPGSRQKTNLRIKEQMDNSKDILLYIIDINKFVFNGKRLNESSLENKYIRRGLEGFLIEELRKKKNNSIIHNRL